MKLIHITKTFAAAGALACVACLHSCKSDDFELPAITADGYTENTQQAYFDTPKASTIELSADANTFSVPVLRLGRDAATVPVTTTFISQNVQHIQGGSSISFAQGQAEGQLVYTYDPTLLQLGQFDTLQVTIDPSCATAYGANTLTLVVGQSEPWISLGYGYYSDAFEGEGAYKVEILQNANQPNRFRIMNPYDEMAATEYPDDLGNEISEYMEITLLSPGDQLAGVTISEEGLVYFSPTISGYYQGEKYGTDMVNHPSDVPELFEDGLTEENFLYSHVTNWQEPDADGNVLPATISLSGWYGLTVYGPYPSWNFTTNEWIEITFPGVVLHDYSAEIDFTSLTFDNNGNTYAVGNIKLGADVDYAELYIMKYDEEADDYDVENGIFNITSDGEYQVLFSDTPDGYYCLEVYTFDAEGNMKGDYYTDDYYFKDGQPAEPEEADPEGGEEGDEEAGEDDGDDSSEAKLRLKAKAARLNALKAVKAYKAARGK